MYFRLQNEGKRFRLNLHINIGLDALRWKFSLSRKGIKTH